MEHALLVDATPLAVRVRRARGFIARTLGLIGKRVGDCEGMWFSRCSAIHTLGMRCAVDVVFLDRLGRVTALRENVAPGRVLTVPRDACDVLEMGAGFIAGHEIRRGALLALAEPSGS